MSRYMDVTMEGDPDVVGRRARRAFDRVGKVRDASSPNRLAGTVYAKGFDVVLEVEWKPALRAGSTDVSLRASSGGRSGRAADSAMSAWVDAYSATGDLPGDGVDRGPLHRILWVGFACLVIATGYLLLRR